MNQQDLDLSVPYGYCQCGCGQKTAIVAFTDSRRGRVKGEPSRYLPGHRGLPVPPPYIDNGICFVPLRSSEHPGHVAMVDPLDFDSIRAFRWIPLASDETWYATAWMPTPNRPQGQQVRMHRFLLGLTGSKPDVDHQNHNGLDNRRGNIRICTGSQNQANSRSRRGVSRFRGVVWNKTGQRWQAQIQNRYIGLFETEEDAAHAYDRAAIQTFGAFATLNFPHDIDMTLTRTEAA